MTAVLGALSGHGKSGDHDSRPWNSAKCRHGLGFFGFPKKFDLCREWGNKRGTDDVRENFSISRELFGDG